MARSATKQLSVFDQAEAAQAELKAFMVFLRQRDEDERIRQVRFGEETIELTKKRDALRRKLKEAAGKADELERRVVPEKLRREIGELEGRERQIDHGMAELRRAVSNAEKHARDVKGVDRDAEREAADDVRIKQAELDRAVAEKRQVCKALENARKERRALLESAGD